MTIKAEFKIQGLDELQRQFKKLPGVMQKRLVATATRSGANVIKKEAKRRAPKRAGGKKKRGNWLTEPGFLKANIKIKRINSRFRYGAIYDINYGAAFYGDFIERGFTNKRVNRKISPKPFMRPAFDSKENEAGAQMELMLWRGILREVAKL